MSNHLAPAAVSATLRKSLQAALDTANPGISNARVTTLRPNSPQAELPAPGVNVFLYQATASGPLRNDDLPTRRADGTVVGRPSAALELHYLLSFTGDDTKLEPQILYGITTRALHQQAIITRQMIVDMLADPTFRFMAGADLADAPELVRLTPVGLSLEELSKLWSVVFQTPYVLSAVYRASVIFIDGTVAPQEPLPVRTTVVQVNASLGPVLTDVLSQASPTAPELADAPIVTNSLLVLVGRDLMTEVTRLRIGSIELPPDPSAISETKLRVALPPSLPAGAQIVRVVQRKTVAPTSLDTFSNPMLFALAPTITASFAAGAITVEFTPAIGQGQHVSISLNPFDTPPDGVANAFRFDVPRRPSATPATSITLSIAGVPPGEYLVRATVDEVQSPLGFDAALGKYNAPRITVS